MKAFNMLLKVWNKSEMKSMEDYHNLCLKWGVLLLIHMSEKIRNSRQRNYTLCSCHYMSVAALSQDAMLEMTKVQIFFPILKCICFRGKGMGGDVFYISKRYSKANNKYLSSYDPKKAKHFKTQIMYMVISFLNFFQHAR